MARNIEMQQVRMNGLIAPLELLDPTAARTEGTIASRGRQF
jgi:hypothetical protein